MRSFKRAFLKRSGFIDSLLLIVLVCALVKPLFRLKYLDNWPSIESTFISDARILGEHLPHTGWQPLWYCGTRTDYIYPPALRYGTALIAALGHVVPARAYHLYVGILYVLGILAIYWLVRIGSGSRISALLASIATALLSPSFLLLPALRIDSGFWVPQRLHVLMSYGEGPHVSALSVLPAALAAACLALRKRNPVALAAAGALCAFVVANNFYGATALAICYPILVWSVWVGDRSRTVWRRALAIPALAWGLSAFWFTPSYLRITLLNMKWVSQPGSGFAGLVLLGAVLLYCLFSFGAASARPERIWQIFVFGVAFILSVYVLGFFYFGLRSYGEPARMVPELDLFLILALAEVFRLLWQNHRFRAPAVLLLLMSFSPAVRYLKHVWSPFPRSKPLEEIYEYRVANWVADHLPGARVLPSGSNRFWFDAWANNAQPDGGSMQGMLNQKLPDATWEIQHGDRSDRALLWLRALGIDALVVPDRTSPEAYHDYEHPEKFRGALPVLNDDTHGTVVYGVPRLYPGITRIVDRAAMEAVDRLPGANDEELLKRYVAIVEDTGAASASLQWKGFDAAEIHAATGPGQSVLVQETWDPAWHAYENGVRLPIRQEGRMSFMLIDVSPGGHDIRMRFEIPLENRAGQILFALTGLIIVGICVRR